MHAAAGLSDVLARPLLLIGVFGAEEGAASAGVDAARRPGLKYPPS
jgi:hypothetical protein